MAITSAPYALVGAGALAVVGIVYRPWSGRWRIPWSYGLDNVGYAIFVRNLQLHGSYHFTDSLGAPWTQELYDFPQGATRLNLIAWRLLGLVIDDPFTVLNVHFILASAVIAMVAFGVLKRFGLPAPMAGALAIVYTFLPYRFWHGLQHVTLSAYFTVPLAALLALWIVDGRFSEAWRALRAGDRRGSLRLLITPAVVVLVAGSADPYYTVFAVILVLLAGAAEAIRCRTWSTLICGAAVAVGLAAVMSVNLLPEVLYRHEHGTNERVTERTPAESEGYALHLTQMLLPDPNHRVSGLASYGKAAREVPAPGEGGTSLGLLATTGFLISVGSVLGLTAVRRARWMRVRQLGVWELGLVLVAIVGGAGFTLAVFGFTQIRSWGRLVIFIGFLALAAVGLALTGLSHRLADRRGVDRSVVTAALALVLGVLGLVDTIPVDQRPAYASVKAARDSDRAFVDSMEASLPDRAMVFQLPVVPFPETPLVGMGSYDLARPYVLGHDKLRWSFGGLKGRIADWQEVWIGETDMRRFVEGIAAVGFAALYVDTFGYSDRGTQLDATLSSFLGAPAGTSEDGRLHWYDLRPFAADLAARLGPRQTAVLGTAVSTLVRTDFGDGISAFEDGAGGPARWLGAEGHVIFPNNGPAGRQVVVRTDLVGPPAATVRATGGGINETVTLTGGPDHVDWTLTLPTGTSELVLSTDAAPQSANDGVDRRVRLVGLSTSDAAVERVLGRG
jgi:phosphoglycerol transferase